jgi:hypothetical protein
MAAERRDPRSVLRRSFRPAAGALAPLERSLTRSRPARRSPTAGSRLVLRRTGIDIHDRAENRDQQRPLTSQRAAEGPGRQASRPDRRLLPVGHRPGASDAHRPRHGPVCDAVPGRVEPAHSGGSKSRDDAAEVQPAAAELQQLPGHLHGRGTAGAPPDLPVRRVRLQPAGCGPAAADRQLAELRRQPQRGNRAVPAATAGHRLRLRWRQRATCSKC